MANEIQRLINILVNNKEANKALDETTRKLNSMDNAATKTTKSISQLTISQDKNKNKTKEQTSEVAKLAEKYINLRTQEAAARAELDRLTASQNANAASLKKVSTEAETAGKKANQLQGVFSSLSKGSFGGIVGGLTSVLGPLAGLASAGALLKEIVSNSREVETLGLSMKFTSKSAEDLIVNQGFLTDISERYGVEIKGLTKQFISFNAAAKESVSQNEIRDLFESIAKSSAALGLSLDSQTGAFLALEQMASKGVVSMEELRRQLGNALPGAITAASNAYNELHKGNELTLGQFQKLVGEGEVLTSDIFPALGKAFEKLYGIESLERVDSLNAQINRLTNSWTEFTVALGKTGIISFFTTFISLLTDAANIISDIVKDWKTLQGEALMGGIVSGGERFANDIKFAKEQNDLLLVGLKKGTKEYNDALELGKKNLDGTVVALGNLANSNLWDIMSKIQEQEEKIRNLGPKNIGNAGDIKDANVELTRLKKLEGYWKGVEVAIVDYNGSLNENTGLVKENTSAVGAQIDLEKEWLKLLEDIDKALDKNSKTLLGLIDKGFGPFYDKLKDFVDIWYQNEVAVKDYYKAYSGLIDAQKQEIAYIENSAASQEDKVKAIAKVKREHQEHLKDLGTEQEYIEKQKLVQGELNQYLKILNKEYDITLDRTSAAAAYEKELLAVKKEMVGIERVIKSYTDEKGEIVNNNDIIVQYERIIKLSEARLKLLHQEKFQNAVNTKEDATVLTERYLDAERKYNDFKEKIDIDRAKRKETFEGTDDEFKLTDAFQKESKELNLLEAQRMSLKLESNKKMNEANKLFNDIELEQFKIAYDTKTALDDAYVENYINGVNEKIAAEEQYASQVETINQNLQGFLSMAQDEYFGLNNELKNMFLVAEKGIAIAQVWINNSAANAKLGTDIQNNIQNAVQSNALAAKLGAEVAGGNIAAGVGIIPARMAATAYTGAAALGKKQIVGNTINAGISTAAILATTLTSWNKGGGGAAGGTGGGGGGAAGAQFNIVGSSGTNQLAAQIGASQNQPVEAFVVGKAVTNQQQLDANKIKTATFF